MTPAGHAEEIVRIISDRDHVLVVAHASPDGDAMGCTAGMGWLLRDMGKSFALFNKTGVPDCFSWMALPCPLVARLRDLPFRPELLVVMDCGDFWRIGSEPGAALQHLPSVNIDHHSTNPGFGTLHNWVDADMAAAGMMLEHLADAAGVPLVGGLAESIYLSMISDTGSFAHGNTTADVFRLAERLLRNGLDAASLRDRYDHQWTLAKTRFWGWLMGRIRTAAGGRVALCSVGLREMADAGVSKEDLDGFAEQMRRIRGVRFAVLLREIPGGGTKCSLRSFGDDDVRSVAARFGGGGHRNAAGATLGEDPPEAEAVLLPLLEERL